MPHAFPVSFFHSASVLACRNRSTHVLRFLFFWMLGRARHDVESLSSSFPRKACPRSPIESGTGYFNRGRESRFSNPFWKNAGCRIESGMMVGALCVTPHPSPSFPCTPLSSFPHAPVRHSCEDHHSSSPTFVIGDPGFFLFPLFLWDAGSWAGMTSGRVQPPTTSFPRKRESRVFVFSFFSGCWVRGRHDRSSDRLSWQGRVLLEKNLSLELPGQRNG